ncbi:MAG: preprotein translocase subunit SecY [Dehalococcoidia bacterium]|jgi:preprotein translocase subunit SecY|uniref:preprotein translocase subunit SecY n=1 Tax=Candidatus Amarobacter glycogenicus TaxID=3140699 RepID=UPI002A15FB05|nr:preprotein translocase subunit SecY [Dehalococcoidia bacterium]MBK7127530.1 preprotein translocase subunit SecY [Dehalococcoidia bacterium]MBK7330242.1 preprotein translocase subunit SecY [Dehalococcoidia bacterium]MBK8560094.1 preprotein translocase subunit SecY [Dehalococcoidia bacterium]MBK9342167.1 preprotein translocase subunit SecY [Dehalococcoidia bacterium]
MAVQPAQRPRLLQAMVDAFRQEDVRRKLLFTLAMLVVFRFVAHVPIPNVDRDALEAAFEGNALLDFLSIFSGGALQNLSVAALGVYPYITASIIIQILTPLVPSFRALSEEGEQGRRRLQLYTHWMAPIMAFVQGYGQIVFINGQSGGDVVQDFGIINHPIGTLSTLLTLAAGTMFLVWLGELITENGIGNGVSVIIFGGIVARLPALIPSLSTQSIIAIIGFAAFALGLIYLVVFFQEAQRRVPVQYARSAFRGGRMYRQQGQSHIPLRVNMAGMIPLIFAFSIMILPPIIASYFTSAGGWVESVAEFFVRQFQGGRGGGGTGWYWAILFAMVVGFTFFYTMVQYQQQQIAKNLQRQGAFIPGIRPGAPTEAYLQRVVTRITWAGAFFLGFVAILPFFIGLLTDVRALTVSTTGFLIVVAVVLDTMKQLEAQLLMRNYEGFIR